MRVPGPFDGSAFPLPDQHADPEREVQAELADLRDPLGAALRTVAKLNRRQRLRLAPTSQEVDHDGPTVLVPLRRQPDPSRLIEINPDGSVESVNRYGTDVLSLLRSGFRPSVL